MRRPRSALLLSFPAFIHLVLAVPAVRAEGDPDVDEKVLVTATRLDDTGVARVEVPAHVTILDRKQIEASGARNLQDLLSQEAGVVLIDQVGNDVQKTLDLRGFATGQGVAVFVDGARVADPRNNLAALEQVPLDAIERVEVTRGPSAALAGGGSEAGVVRVVTRRGTTPSASISLSGGTVGTFRADGDYGSRFGRFDLFASGAYDTTDGFRPNSGGDQERFDVTGGVDLDGGRRVSLALLSSSLSYGAPGALTLAEFDANPYQNIYNVLDNSDVDQRQASLTFQGPVGAGFSLAATAAYRTDRSKSLTTGRAASTFGGFYLDADGDTWSGVVQVTRPIGQGPRSHLVAFGIEALDGSSNDLGYSTSPTSPGTFDPGAPSSNNTAGATNVSLFAQDTWTIDRRWILNFGARGDRSHVHYDESIPGNLAGSTTFSKLSFRGGVTLQASERADVYASYGDAFLPPTPEQLFAFPGFGSNPDLKPQDARAYEIGSHIHGAIGGLDLAAFWTDTNDEIVFDPTPTSTDPFGRNVNAGKTVRRGVEISGRGRFSHGVAAFVTGSFTDSSFTNGTNDGKEVPLVPRWRASAGIDAALPRGFGLAVDALYVGSQVLDNDTGNTQSRLDAYTVVNARARWEHAAGRSAKAGKLQLFAEARNLFDEVYATRGIYAFDFSTFLNSSFVTPAPGRRYLAGVSWRM